MDEAQSRRTIFAGALESHLRGIYLYFRRLGVDAATAEDLAQEAFLIAWQNLASLRDTRKLRGWLYGIAYHRYLQYRDNIAAKPLVAIGDEHPAAAADEPGSEQSLSAQAIREAVRGLPEEYLHPIALLYWQELSYKEAAKVLSIPIGTLAWRVHKALKMLRQALAEKGEEDENHSPELQTARTVDTLGKG